MSDVKIFLKCLRILFEVLKYEIYQFSYIPVSPEMACQELRSLGFEVSLNASAKDNFEAFVRKSFLFFEDTDLALKIGLLMRRLTS